LEVMALTSFFQLFIHCKDLNTPDICEA